LMIKKQQQVNATDITPAKQDASAQKDMPEKTD